MKIKKIGKSRTIKVEILKVKKIFTIDLREEYNFRYTFLAFIINFRFWKSLYLLPLAQKPSFKALNVLKQLKLWNYQPKLEHKEKEKSGNDK